MTNRWVVGLSYHIGRSSAFWHTVGENHGNSIASERLARAFILGKDCSSGRSRVGSTRTLLPALLTIFHRSHPGRCPRPKRCADRRRHGGDYRCAARGVAHTGDGRRGRVCGSQPGTYRVAVTKGGFKRFERTNIQLEVPSDARIDVVLQPGDATQTVVVNEE